MRTFNAEHEGAPVPECNRDDCMDAGITTTQSSSPAESRESEDRNSESGSGTGSDGYFHCR